MEFQTNWLAVIVAALSAFMLGGAWYSPALFGKAWMVENGFSVKDVEKGNKKKIFGLSIVLSLLMAINLAMFLTDPAEGCGKPTTITWGATAGFLAGIWTFSSVAIIALFEQKSLRYVMINGGYTVAALTIMGTILGAWR